MGSHDVMWELRCDDGKREREEAHARARRTVKSVERLHFVALGVISAIEAAEGMLDVLDSDLGAEARVRAVVLVACDHAVFVNDVLRGGKAGKDGLRGNKGEQRS